MPDTNTRISDVILKAAELIRERGFEATTISEICTATRLTKGGLYHYISSKRELLYQIMRFGMEILDRDVVEPTRGIEDPEEQLRALIRLQVEQIAHGQGLLAILSEEVEGLDPGRRDEILHHKRRYFDYVRGILERLRDAGELGEVDLNVATFNILAQILFFARWYSGSGPLSPAEIADQIAATSLRGIARRESEPVLV